MTADSRELSPRMAPAVAVFARGGTVNEAAEAAKVDRRTVLRWRQLPAFSAAVRVVVSDAFADAVAVLSDASGDASRYLADVARGHAPCDGGRVNAARLVLTLGPSLRDAVELEARLSALEDAIGGQDASG
ncbi:MAG: hypothetical protein IPG72_05930 [Ardenticatenales bacterium]|nr:hypothetical protein [Ardenticatenales bacterium]